MQGLQGGDSRNYGNCTAATVHLVVQGTSPRRHAHWRSQGMCCSADLMPCLQSLLCRLQHPNIVPFLGACDDPPTLLLEFYQHGSISWVVHKAARQLQLQRQGHIQPDKAEVRLVCCAVGALVSMSIARRPCHCCLVICQSGICLCKCHLCTPGSKHATSAINVSQPCDSTAKM